MFRPESWSCRSTAEWECTWYHRWLPMNGCNRIRTIFVSLFTGKKLVTYFSSQRTISAAIPWDAWTAWPQNPPWGCLPCRSWSSQPCLHTKWVGRIQIWDTKTLEPEATTLELSNNMFPDCMQSPYGHSLSFNQPSCGYCSVCLQ